MSREGTFSVRDTGGTYRRMEWITCKRCGTRKMARAGGKGFCSRSCARKGENHPFFGKCGADSRRWKGGDAGYESMHRRVRQLRGSADHCTQCGQTDPEVWYEWASLTRNYADPHDYAAMCKACHSEFDDATRARGDGHGRAKLTSEIVREARRRYAAGDGTSVSLAREFGVTTSAMYKAIMRETWKCVS